MAPPRDSSDRRKRARSLVYLAVSRLQWPLTSPRLCSGCVGGASTATLAAFHPLCCPRPTNYFYAPDREKIGFSLLASKLSAIFRSARVRNTKKYFCSGLFESRTEEIPSRLRFFWRFSVGSGSFGSLAPRVTVDQWSACVWMPLASSRRSSSSQDILAVPSEGMVLSNSGA